MNFILAYKNFNISYDKKIDHHFERPSRKVRNCYKQVCEQFSFWNMQRRIRSLTLYLDKASFEYCNSFSSVTRTNPNQDLSTNQLFIKKEGYSVFLCFCNVIKKSKNRYLLIDWQPEFQTVNAGNFYTYLASRSNEKRERKRGLVFGLLRWYRIILAKYPTILETHPLMRKKHFRWIRQHFDIDLSIIWNKVFVC